jgi:hypothetical protein
MNADPPIIGVNTVQQSAGTTVRFIETRERGPLGWFFLGLFWLWQCVALIGPFLLGDVSPEEAQRQALVSREQAEGEMIVGIVIWFAVWAFGSVGFGAMAHFTRGRKVLTHEAT